MTSALDMPEIMSYIYSKSWKHKFSASSSIIIIEDYYLQTFLHSLLFLAYQYVIYRCVQQPAQSIQVVDSRKALPLLCQAVDNFFLNFFLPLHYTSFRQDFYRKLIHSSLIVTVVKLPAKFYSLIGIYYYSFKPYIQKFIRNLCNFRLSFPFLFVYTG